MTDHHKTFLIAVIWLLSIISFPLYEIKANSETNELKNLQYNLKKASGDSAMVTALNKIAWYFLYIDLDSALTYAKQAYKLSRSDRDFAKSASVLGVTYSKAGDFESSVKYNLEAFRYAQIIHDKRIYAFYLNNIGTNYLMLDDLDKAIDYYTRALENSHHLEQTSVSLIQLGQIYAIQGNFNKAYDYFEKSLNVAEKANDSSLIARTYNRIGELYLDKKYYKKSVYYYNKSLKMLEPDDLYYKIACLRGIAESYIGTGKYEMALKVTLQADSIAKKGGFIQALSDINLVMSILYDSLQKPSLSIVYYKRYTAIKDSMFNLEKNTRISFLQTEFETKKHEMEAKQFEQEARFNKKMSYVYLFLSVLILLTLFYFIKNIRQKNKILRIEKEKLALELDKKHREILTHALQINQQKEVLVSVQSEIVNIVKLRAPKKIIYSVKQLISGMKNRIALSDDWDLIKLHFEEVHPDFFTRIKNDFPDLTINDLKLCVYSKLKLTNKEVGRLLNINYTSVQVSRYRLKKKMNVPDDVNFDDFINNY